MDRLWRGLAGVVFVAFGCSGKATSAAGPASSSPPIAEADFAATYTQAACSVLGKCCGAAGIAFDAQACSLSVRPSTSNERRVYDPARAGECIALVRGLGDSCSMTGALSDQIQKVCDWAYTGKQAIGQPCGSERDCVGSYDELTMCGVDLVDGGLVSTCKPVQFGNAGDQCSGLSLACAPGLSCSALAVCEPMIPAGQACVVGGAGCAEGLLCVAGTCGPKLANGAACRSGSECQSTTCYGDRCVASEPFSAVSCAMGASTP